MHTFSSTMPRLFGRAPTPTPAAASVAPAATAATAATATASTNAPPRAKLVRKSHMHLAPVPLASRASMASRVSLGSLGSLGSMGSGSVPMPPLSPSSSLSFGLTGTGPSQGLPLLETHREGSFVSTSAASASASASAYEGLLNDYDRSSLSGQRLSAHQHYTVRPRTQRNVHRAWLSAADARQSSWSGERPPPRKLVKDPNGSARPTAARELVDDDLRHRVPANLNDDTDKGTLGLRRKMARWRDLRW